MEIHPSAPPSLPTNDVEDSYRLHRRFDRMGRLVGDGGMKTLFSSHVMVIGLGGVGSHAAEALVRSGVGKVTLVDFDKVCITNTNRQLQAMKGKVGKYKSSVLSERLQQINPQAEVVDCIEFYNADSSERLLGMNPDYVIDAIDNVTAKCHLLSSCRARNPGGLVNRSVGKDGPHVHPDLRPGIHADRPLGGDCAKVAPSAIRFPSNRGVWRPGRVFHGADRDASGTSLR